MTIYIVVVEQQIRVCKTLLYVYSASFYPHVITRQLFGNVHSWCFCRALFGEQNAKYKHINVFNYKIQCALTIFICIRLLRIYAFPLVFYEKKIIIFCTKLHPSCDVRGVSTAPYYTTIVCGRLDAFLVKDKIRTRTGIEIETIWRHRGKAQTFKYRGRV